MTFGEGSSADELCERYPTEEAALAGHYAIVSLVAAEMTDPIVMDADQPTTQ